MKSGFSSGSERGPLFSLFRNPEVGRLPDPPGPIQAKNRIPGENRHVLFRTLGHQQSVERVPVMEGQGGKTCNMPDVDGQNLEIVEGQLFGKEFFERSGKPEFSEADLDRPFPDTGETDKPFRLRVGKECPYPGREEGIRRDPPEKRMGIEKNVPLT